MGLKFYLNKFLRVDNVESYYLPELLEIKKAYEDFLDSSEGFDPDFPMSTFGNKGHKIGGTNIHTLEKPVDDEDSSETTLPDIQDARNTTVEERALNFLKNIGMKTS